MTAPHTVAGHTAGPWEAANGSTSYDIVDQDGRLLARLWGDKGNYPLSQFADTSYLTHDEHVANAHLFAAAPDLLAVARMVVEASELAGFSGPLGDTARAAIAKATAARQSGEDA